MAEGLVVSIVKFGSMSSGPVNESRSTTWYSDRAVVNGTLSLTTFSKSLIAHDLAPFKTRAVEADADVV
jgi:hypothetical protein